MPDHPRVSPYRLERRDDGRWEVRWFVKPPGKNQQQRRRLPKVADQRDFNQAEAWLNRWQGPEDRAEIGVGYTVERAIEDYIVRHARPKGQERSARNNLRASVKAMGNLPADGLCDGDITAYTKKRLKEVKSSTVRREIAGLQAAMNWAMKKVLASPKRFHFDKPPDGVPRDRWITEDQEREIRSLLPKAPLDVQIFFELAITYAARRGAILDLHFGRQIDFIGGYIDFHPAGVPETNKRRPRGPMFPHVRDLLAQRMQEVGGGRVLDGWTTIHRYERFMEEIGYRWVTPHVLKHSAITLMLRGGVRPEDAAAATGTSLHTIMKHYRHHSKTELLSIFGRRATEAPNQ